MADEGGDSSGGEGGGALENFKNKVVGIEKTIENELKKDVGIVAEKTHMPPWSIFLIIAILLLGILGGLGWFVLRFFKKKKPTGAEDKKEGDEEGLVDNEEKPEEIEKEPEEEEKAGRIHYKMEYNFNSQELTVTVIECAELPPTDWSTGATDPFVKVYLLPEKKPKFETKVHRKNCNPKFNETFVFKNLPYVDSFDKTLVFSVYDYDLLSASDKTAELQLPLNTVDLSKQLDEWRDLPPVDDGSNQYLGDLCLSLRYVPTTTKLTVAVLEARKLKKMDLGGASDPYVKIKLFDSKGKRIGKKKKTSVKSNNLNPYWNESFVFLIDEYDMKKVFLDVTVCDYDFIGGGDPIGKIWLGMNQSKKYKPGYKHWKECLENPRRPVIKWHVLQDAEEEEDDDDKKKKDKDGKDKKDGKDGKKDGKDGKKDGDKKDDKKDKKDEKKDEKKK